MNDRVLETSQFFLGQVGVLIPRARACDRASARSRPPASLTVSQKTCRSSVTTSPMQDWSYAPASRALRFCKLSYLVREQYVYDALRNKYWKSLNQTERRHAMTYIRSLGGRA
jgi:hypothetical protein